MSNRWEIIAGTGKLPEAVPEDDVSPEKSTPPDLGLDCLIQECLTHTPITQAFSRYEDWYRNHRTITMGGPRGSDKVPAAMRVVKKYFFNPIFVFSTTALPSPVVYDELAKKGQAFTEHNLWNARDVCPDCVIIYKCPVNLSEIYKDFAPGLQLVILIP